MREDEARGILKLSLET